MLDFLVLALFLLPVVTTAPTGLRPYPATAMGMFFSSDSNGDGILQRQELMFTHFDTDGDGRVSRYEYTSYLDSHNPNLHAYAHALYDIYDVDKDHHLEAHDLDNFYSLMEGNGDGLVSKDEYIRYWSILLESLEHLHSPVG